MKWNCTPPQSTSTDRYSSSSGGTMMNESPSHNADATRFPEKSTSSSSGGNDNVNGESPSSLGLDSAIGGSASPDLMQVREGSASRI